MANFPGAMNSLPGVYGPSNYWFNYNDTTLILFYNGGIQLDKGNWTDAAIAFFSRNPTVTPFFKYGDITVQNGSLDLVFDPCKDQYRNKHFTIKETAVNFEILKNQYDKIRKLPAFW